jgi:hypothetical protein
VEANWERDQLAFGHDDPGVVLPAVPANDVGVGEAQGGVLWVAADADGAGQPARLDVEPAAPVDVNPGANSVGNCSDGGG